jgi:hypothetical protein
MHPLVRRAKQVRKAFRERRELKPARVAIVSFPKSGRTWLRLLIGRALCERYRLPESQILDTFALSRAAGILPTVFSHDGTSNTEGRHLRRLDREKRGFRGKRVLLLCRDPRDTVISCFFEATRRKQVYQGTLSEFLRDPHYGIEKIVRFYELWHAASGVPESLLVVSYEDLHADPAKVLRETLAFLGATEVPDAIVSGAIDYGRFDNMRRIEQAGGLGEGSRLRAADPSDPSSFKTRQGRVGGFAETLSKPDLAFANRAIAESACPLLAAYRG